MASGRCKTWVIGSAIMCAVSTNVRKKRIEVSVLVVLVLLMAFGLGYQAGLSHARKAPRDRCQGHW